MTLTSLDFLLISVLILVGVIAIIAWLNNVYQTKHRIK